MAFSAAAPVACGTRELEAAVPAGEDDLLAAGAVDEPAAAVLLMMAVELTPGTIGVTKEVGTMGIAVAAGVETAGTDTAGVETTTGTEVRTVPATGLVAGGAWIWPSLI